MSDGNHNPFSSRTPPSGPPVRLLRVEGTRPCRILRRVNRLVVLIEEGGKERRAHITNTGRLEEYLENGRWGFCFPTPETQKTECRLFAVEEEASGALIDTQFQMRAFEKAWEAGFLSWLSGFRLVRRNPRIGISRMDCLFQHARRPVPVEAKSAVLRKDGFALSPDCPTLRGQRHVKDLPVDLS